MDAKILVLRHQLMILRRKVPRGRAQRLRMDELSKISLAADEVLVFWTSIPS